MLRRLLPTLLVLGAGLVALLWGLLALQGIFLREREQAVSALTERRRALEQYARQALREAFSERLRRATPGLQRALDDPLAPAAGLYYRAAGEQRLPRQVRFRAGTDQPARALYRAIVADGPLPPSESDDPWTERLRRVRAVSAAIAAGRRARIASGFRALLAHQARFVVPTVRDLPATLALLDLLDRRSRPDPRLMAMLLRRGLPYGRAGRRIPGLQRRLLRHRRRFGKADFAFLREKVIELSSRQGVRHDDFAARARAQPRAPLRIPAEVTRPSLALGGRWYVAPEGADQLAGIRVHPSRLVGSITARMRTLGLLGAEDSATLPPLGARAVPLDRLGVRVSSPQWARRRAEIRDRFRLKTGLVVACGVLALILAALAVALQRRKQRYLQLQSDFVSSVSHELRTPLASIGLLAETLERKTADRPDLREYAGRILRDGEGLQFLVENILSFNRIEKGRWVLRRSPVELTRLLAPLPEELAAAAGRPVELDASGLCGLTLDGDPELLRLLFANLGRNACQYNVRTPVRISIRARREGAGLTLLFSDNGVGIPPAETRQVFREFHRARRSTPTGVRGSGLGLALCRRIARLHGGRIRVASTDPEGTTFELRFPRGAGAVAPVEA